MRKGSGKARVWRFRLWPAVLTSCMMIVLLGLGAWQVARLHWKEALLATIEARVHAPPVALDFERDAGRDMDYRAVTASGLFLPCRALYLFSLGPGGPGGYHVLAPMTLADKAFLLVDRGWIPYDRRKEDGRDCAAPEGPVRVTGLLRKPERHWFQPANDPARNDWYTLDLAAMAAASGVDGYFPYVLEADGTPNPGGYPVGGQTRLELPNNHLSYALTWYGLAAALLVIYLLSGFRKEDDAGKGGG